MNKKITFKDWASTFFKGIWQALCWVGRAFNPKYKTPFWRIVWGSITVCVIAFTCMLGYAFYDEFYARQWRRAYWDQQLGEHVYFHNSGKGKGYVYTLAEGEKNKTVKGVDWVVKSVNGDSLAVFSQKGKRGYLNRNNGRVVIPAQYDAAWVFSDGVAGVCQNDSVWFIDVSNTPINPQKFKRTQGYNDYCFHGDFVKMPHGKEFGFVTKTGDWTVQFYDNVEIVAKNLWRVSHGGKSGVLSDSLKCIVPLEYKNVYVGYRDGIIATDFENIQKLYGFDGSIINDYVIDGVEKLSYQSDDYDKEGERLLKAANVDSYYVNNRYGLISKDGKPITLAKYSSISALSPDTYLCEYSAGGVNEIINSKGEVVSEQP